MSQFAQALEIGARSITNNYTDQAHRKIPNTPLRPRSVGGMMFESLRHFTFATFIFSDCIFPDLF